jgi:[ribosomal protein S18]-alanine N-acetyltransferase
MDTLIFRQTIQEDLPGILETEACSFSSPWKGDTFLLLLSDMDSYSVTALNDGRVVGYCFTQTMQRMIHLLNLAVHPDYRRKGIARLLLNEIILFAISTNKSYVFLEVRISNSIAQALYDSMGFTHAFTWHRYYSEIGEDASIMMKRIAGTMA